MSGVSDDKDQVSAHIPKPQGHYLFARAERVGLKKSTYVAALISWWFRNGMPPVTEADAAMEQIHGKIRFSSAPPLGQSLKTEGPPALVPQNLATKPARKH